MVIPIPRTAIPVRNDRMKMSGRSIWDRRTRTVFPWSVNGRSIWYRVPIPRAVSPSPMNAPAAMIAPQSARIERPPVKRTPAGLHPEHALDDGQESAADEQDDGQDHDDGPAPAPRPGAERPAGPVGAGPPEEPAAAQRPAAV